MNHHYSFENLPHYVLIQADGIATVSGCEALVESLVSSPEWKSEYLSILDFRNLDFSHFTTGDIREVAGILEKYYKRLGGGACAFVVRNTLEYGLIRMFEMLSGAKNPMDVRVFYSMGDAVQWITK